MTKKIKILVGYHKRSICIKNDIFVPIHLGRALVTEDSKDGEMSKDDYQWLLDNMIGDDWVGKYDYLKEQGVQVIYFPYGEGISSSNLKKKIYDNYRKLQQKADNHLPVNTSIKLQNK